MSPSVQVSSLSGLAHSFLFTHTEVFFHFPPDPLLTQESEWDVSRLSLGLHHFLRRTQEVSL